MSTAASTCDRIISMIDTCLAEYERNLRSTGRSSDRAPFESSAPRWQSSAPIGRDATRLLVTAGMPLL
jgi:hypothetical protein